MSKEEEQKTALAAQTLSQFFCQFGDDIYAEILLEELFKGLMNEEALFVFGEQKQTRNQVNYSSSNQRSSQQQNNRFERIGPSNGLGKENISDYP